jgi:transposase InsO family protein
VCQALLNAWANAPAPVGNLFHSDRGSQYASSNFRRTIQSLRFVQGMSRKANCWDNAIAESFFATLKREEVTVTDETEAQARQAIACYVHGFYNPTRMHSAPDYLSPNDFAKNSSKMLDPPLLGIRPHEASPLLMTAFMRLLCFCRSERNKPRQKQGKMIV